MDNTNPQKDVPISNTPGKETVEQTLKKSADLLKTMDSSAMEWQEFNNKALAYLIQAAMPNIKQTDKNGAGYISGTE